MSMGKTRKAGEGTAGRKARFKESCTATGSSEEQLPISRRILKVTEIERGDFQGVLLRIKNGLPFINVSVVSLALGYVSVKSCYM